MALPSRLCKLILPFLVLLCHSLASPELMTYEPVEHLKGHLYRFPFDESESLWKDFFTLNPRDLKNAMATIKKNLASVLSHDTSVLLLKGENVFVEKLAKGVSHDSSLEIPSANILSLLALTLPILLEDYKAKTLTDPIGKLLKGDHLKHPLVKGREALSLMELVRNLPPTTNAAGLLTDPTLLPALGSHGELAVYVINTLLGTLSSEAWLDALLSAGLEKTKFSTEGGPKLVTSFPELVYFTSAVMHDMSVSFLPPKSDLFPMDSNRFLFSWWFNCPGGKIDESQCLLRYLPTTTIFNLSPGLRMYVLPKLDISLIIANHSELGGGDKAKRWSPTVAELIGEDVKIWKQFYSVVDPSFKDESEQKDGTGQDETEEKHSLLVDAFYTIFPISVFIFYILFSHVWVYWVVHLFWFVITFFSKRAHIPRPETSKDQ